MRAAALAMGAEQRYRLDDSVGDADRADGDLALATALLDMPHGPALELVSPFISCASALAERGLCELEAEMYARADSSAPLPLLAASPPWWSTSTGSRRSRHARSRPAGRSESALAWPGGSGAGAAMWAVPDGPFGSLPHSRMITYICECT